MDHATCVSWFKQGMAVLPCRDVCWSRIRKGGLWNNGEGRFGGRLSTCCSFQRSPVCRHAQWTLWLNMQQWQMTFPLVCSLWRHFIQIIAFTVVKFPFWFFERRELKPQPSRPLRGSWKIHIWIGKINEYREKPGWGSDGYLKIVSHTLPLPNTPLLPMLLADAWYLTD